jgi:hypothetical protein
MGVLVNALSDEIFWLLKKPVITVVAFKLSYLPLDL